jgi:hypothetical protein
MAKHDLTVRSQEFGELFSNAQRSIHVIDRDVAIGDVIALRETIDDTPTGRQCRRVVTHVRPFPIPVKDDRRILILSVRPLTSAEKASS